MRADLGSHFVLPGPLLAIERNGIGHINDTFVGTYRGSSGNVQFVHQRINTSVFGNVAAVMENIGRVTRHMREKLESAGVSDPERRVLTLIQTRAGADYYRDEEGSYWRTYAFIDKSRTSNEVRSSREAYEIALAFGRFATLLADLPGGPLHETIPAFHDTVTRYAQLIGAIETDVVNRAMGVQAEIRFAADRDVLASDIQSAPGARPAHNDAKANNVLLDADTGEGLCIIDLDTVMPGSLLSDFGDLARSAACDTPEDERDLEKIHVQPERFDALARGYAAGAASVLISGDTGLFVRAAKTMTFESGIRFLADFLNGDRYFKIRRAGQNLDRARAQFALLRSFEKHEEDLLAGLALV